MSCIIVDIAPEAYFFIFILVGFSGFVDSIAGGGGLISVPTYLAFGVPVEFILGTNKTVSTTGTTVAVIRYVNAKLICWPVTICAVVTALIGSHIGAHLSQLLSQTWMIYLVIIVAPVVMFLNHKFVRSSKSESPQNSVKISLLSALIGLVIGFYDGFFGPGTGSFLIVAFVWMLGFSLKEASANARIVNYSSNFSAFLTFLLAGKILWPVATVAAVGSMAGNFIGSHLVVNKAEKIVKPIFNLVLTLLILKCFYEIVVA